MELTRPSQNTLRIASKKGDVYVNPEPSDSPTIALVNDGAKFTLSDDYLTIYGPGEFESKGIVVKGSRPDKDTMYIVDTDEGKALYVQASAIDKLSDEEVDVVVINANVPIEESKLASLSSSLIVVFGEDANIPEKVKEHSVTKLNLKKKEELGSNIVYLAKK